jgi:hypothetical protein
LHATIKLAPHSNSSDHYAKGTQSGIHSLRYA